MKRGTAVTVGVLAACLVASGSAAAEPRDFSAIGETTGNRVEGRYTYFYEVLRIRGERIGRARFKCDFGGRRSTCAARAKLRSGTIRGNGTVFDREGGSAIRIVGGDGRYRGARGEWRFKAISRRKSRETFIFRE